MTTPLSTAPGTLVATLVNTLHNTWVLTGIDGQILGTISASNTFHAQDDAQRLLSSRGHAQGRWEQTADGAYSYVLPVAFSAYAVTVTEADDPFGAPALEQRVTTLTEGRDHLTQLAEAAGDQVSFTGTADPNVVEFEMFDKSTGALTGTGMIEGVS